MYQTDDDDAEIQEDLLIQYLNFVCKRLLDKILFV